MSDINLLPDDLKDKELKERKQSALGDSSPKFSNPKERSQKPEEGSPPGRWQQLMSALKKNMNTGEVSFTPSSPPPSSAPPASKPQASNNSTVISSGPAIKPESVPPTFQPSPPLTPKARATDLGGRPPVGQGRARGGVPPAVLDVNLMPAQEGRQLSSRDITGLVLLLLGTILIVVLVYFSLRAYVAQKKGESDAVQQEVIVLQQELEASRMSAEKAIITRRRIQILGNMLQQQGQWGKFFTWLESKTIPVIQLHSLAADANGRITLSGSAPNFTEVGRQMLAFEQSSEVNEITLSNISIDLTQNDSGAPTTVVNFTFTLKLPASLFINE